MSDARTRPTGRASKRSKTEQRRPVLLFFYTATSGPARRMESVVSWLCVRERRRLRLRLVDADTRRELATRLGISAIPTIVLLKDGKVVARAEGRLTGDQLDEAIIPHLDD